MIVSSIAVAVGVLLSFQLVGTALKEERRTVWLEVVKSVRWWMVPVAIADIVTKLILVSLLLQVEWLQFGWWTAMGGSGNLLLGQVSSDTASTMSESSTSILAVVSVVVPIILFLLLPVFAFNEEDTFRFNADRQSNLQRLGIAFVFGMVHMIVGIPLAAALALTASGIIYTAVRVATVKRGMLVEFGNQEAVDQALMIHRGKLMPGINADSKTLKIFNGEVHKVSRVRERSLVKTASVHFLSNAFLLSTILLYVLIRYVILA